MQTRYSGAYAEDRAMIEDLMARYLFAIDYFDWDAYVATFTEDGELEFARGTSKGRAAIREAVSGFAGRIGEFYHTEDGQPATLRHVILQSVIRVEGERGWARSLWLEMANHGPGDTMKMGTYGLYEDDLAKVDGQWLFAKRRILNEFLKGRRSAPATRSATWTPRPRGSWPARCRSYEGCSPGTGLREWGCEAPTSSREAPDERA